MESDIEAALHLLDQTPVPATELTAAITRLLQRPKTADLQAELRAKFGWDGAAFTAPVAHPQDLRAALLQFAETHPQDIKKVQLNFSLKQIELTKWNFDNDSTSVSPEATLFIGWTLSTRRGKASSPSDINVSGLTPLERYSSEMKNVTLKEKQDKKAWTGHGGVVRFRRNKPISEAKFSLDVSGNLELSDLPDLPGTNGDPENRCHGDLRVQVWEVFDEEKQATFLSNVFQPSDPETRKEFEMVQSIKDHYGNARKEAKTRLREILSTTLKTASKAVEVPLGSHGLSFEILQSTLTTAETLATDLKTLTHDAPKLLGTRTITFDYWKTGTGDLKVQWNVAGTSLVQNSVGFALPYHDTSDRSRWSSEAGLVHVSHDGEAIVLAAFDMFTGVAKSWFPDKYIDTTDHTVTYNLERPHRTPTKEGTKE